MARKDDAQEQVVDKLSTEDRLIAVLEKFAAEGRSSGLTEQALEAILSKVGVTNALAMQQALKPENPNPRHLSPFFTEKDYKKYGSYENKPKLRAPDGSPRDVFLNFHKESEEQLTPAEIEAYNSITRDCEAREGQYKAEIKDKGRQLHLRVPVAFMDARVSLPPSLILLIHEMKTGQGVAAMEDLLDEIARLKARLGETDSAAVPAGSSAPTASVALGGTVADLERSLEQQAYPA